MVRRMVLILAVVFLPAVALTGFGQASSQFLQTQYYILSLGKIELDLDGLVQTAKSGGFSVIAYEGESPAVYRGQELVNRSVEEALSDERILVVDVGRFYLRTASAEYTYAVRPAVEGYELVLSPFQDLAIAETLSSVLMSLQEIGIVGDSVDLEFSPFVKNDLKGPPPPTGVALESTLYRLVIAEDWFQHSVDNSLTMIGLRVEVVAEKLPGNSLPERFAPFVVEETEQLAKLLLPIDELIPLAGSNSIGYVRMPYQPVVP